MPERLVRPDYNSAVLESDDVVRDAGDTPVSASKKDLFHVPRWEVDDQSV